MRVFKIYAAVFFMLLLIIPCLVLVFFLNPLPKVRQEDEIESDSFEVILYNTKTDTVEKIDCYEYLCCVLAGEMQANFEPEALKAQTVACYTYMLNRMNYAKNNQDSDVGHEGAYVCDDSAHCMAFLDKNEARNKWGDSFFEKYYSNIEKAVKAVMGEVITYNGELINPVFHSISCGKTQTAEEVWGSKVPYLITSNSTFDTQADGYKTEVGFSEKRFAEIFLDELGIELPKNPANWIGEIEKSESGMTKKLTVADTAYTGTYIRKLLGLRSSCFDVTHKNGEILFTVYGYGHGVGMSQNGANVLAQKGYDYKQILEYYYNGVKIENQIN